jgi:protein TonB
MSFEERVKAEPCAGAFSECLVDGNPEQHVRERRIKRRALAISILLQTLGLTALVIAPLLAKPAELAMRTVPPMPIYRSQPVHRVISDPVRPTVSGPCFKCAMNSRPEPRGAQTATTASEKGDETFIIDIPNGSENSGINVFDPRKQPTRPDTQQVRPQIMHVTRVDPAMLVRRVEPVYPPMARQIRRSGKVELHALIAADGTVQSLELVSGEPLLVQSALDAVKQWRYKPTLLNGQAVEVDTYITVIYTLQQ